MEPPLRCQLHRPPHAGEFPRLLRAEEPLRAVLTNLARLARTTRAQAIAAMITSKRRVPRLVVYAVVVQLRLAVEFPRRPRVVEPLRAVPTNLARLVLTTRVQAIAAMTTSRRRALRLVVPAAVVPLPLVAGELRRLALINLVRLARTTRHLGTAAMITSKRHAPRLVVCVAKVGQDVCTSVQVIFWSSLV